MKVKEIMERNVITVTPMMSVRHTAGLFLKNDISALPVVDDEGTLLGIVSESDLMYRLTKPHLPPHVELLGGVIYLENPFEMKKIQEKLTAVTIKEIMTRKVLTLKPDSDVEDAATLMVEKNINGIPVLENGKIVGIITRHDLLLALSKNQESDSALQNAVVVESAQE